MFRYMTFILRCELIVKFPESLKMAVEKNKNIFELSNMVVLYSSWIGGKVGMVFSS